MAKSMNMTVGITKKKRRLITDKINFSFLRVVKVEFALWESNLPTFISSNKTIERVIAAVRTYLSGLTNLSGQIKSNRKRRDMVRLFPVGVPGVNLLLWSETCQ